MIPEILESHRQIREHLDILLTYVRREIKVAHRSSETKADISRWIAPLGPSLSRERKDEIIKLMTKLTETIEDEAETLSLMEKSLRGLVSPIRDLCQQEMALVQRVIELEEELKKKGDAA